MIWIVVANRYLKTYFVISNFYLPSNFASPIIYVVLISGP
jgi:hypothetical protein